MPTIEASREFEQALELHTRQSTRILHEFASGWYSKHDGESKGEITLEEAHGFVAVALRKLRSELKMQAA